jgi:cytolysin-activating lysine-acyltransferase
MVPANGRSYLLARNTAAAAAQVGATVNGSPVNLAEYYYRFGLVASAMTKSSKYCGYPIACLGVWIEPAIRLDQIHFFYDLSGNPIGYMTWALLAEDTEQRLLNDPDILFHLSEWNEGARLWIMDLVLLDGNIGGALNEAFALFPSFRGAKSLRRRDDGTIRKVTTWRHRT